MREKTVKLEEVMSRLLTELDSKNAVLIDVPFDWRIAQAMRQIERETMPCTPDRIIAATAMLFGLPIGNSWTRPEFDFFSHLVVKYKP